MNPLSAVLVWSGVVVAAGTALRMLLARDPLMRLHYVGPGTALAAPLVVAGLAVASWGSWHDVFKLAVVGVLLAGTGPVTVIATARAVRRRAADD